jgi:hypothetical protein
MMNSIGFSCCCCRINIVNENGKRGMGKQKMEKFDKRPRNKTWKAKG